MYIRKKTRRQNNTFMVDEYIGKVIRYIDEQCLTFVGIYNENLIIEHFLSKRNCGPKNYANVGFL